MRSSLVLVFVLLGAAPALADVISPAESACTGLSAGAACNLDAMHSGVCQMDTCMRLDYAHWDHDASPLMPPTVSYDCLRCLDANDHPDAAAPADAGPAARGGSACAAAPGASGAWGLALIPLAALVFLRLRRR